MEKLISSQRAYQLCTRCVMDISAPEISFDEQGICNFCKEFELRFGHVIHKDKAEKKHELNTFITKVKKDGRNKRYDCIVGVSGGIDSSWVLVESVRQGLRPLAVHMDNGWNSELAQNNIATLVRSLDVDLYTHVIDWDEYRNLMQAFFDADVLDVELLYDNAMLAVNYRMAVKYGVKYILSGSNKATEGMRMPANWSWFKYDKKNIKAIGRRFSGIGLKTFPSIGTWRFIWLKFIRGVQWTSILDLLEYDKFKAMGALQKSFGFKPYAYKHYESIFTRFYQGYLLPAKFGIDKRRLHLGTLVMSGQISREEALLDLEGPPYPSEQALNEDRQYFLKKMGWSAEQLTDYLDRPEIPHTRYPSDYPLAKSLMSVYRFLSKAA